MQIKTTLSKKRLESIEYGAIVMHKAFHCIVVNGPFNSEVDAKLPIVRLTDGKLITLPKKEELHVIENVYLASEYTD